ncbi:MAG TPA: hypothetical protein VFQ44_20680 [Streptosporangiaceae bacterium]|nr:hypothetical protein [Streptosporangiaceae bacterium]
MGWLPDCRDRARYKAYAITHPREAAQRRRDRSYWEWVDRLEVGQANGDPPASRALDTEITLRSWEYPESSDADLGQAEINAEARENADYESYYVGPEFTEPPLNWESWHQPHAEYEKEHYWDPPEERIREVEEYRHLEF